MSIKYRFTLQMVDCQSMLNKLTHWHCKYYFRSQISMKIAIVISNSDKKTKNIVNLHIYIYIHVGNKQLIKSTNNELTIFKICTKSEYTLQSSYLSNICNQIASTIDDSVNNHISVVICFGCHVFLIDFFSFLFYLCFCFFCVCLFVVDHSR